jgi:OOP family OmpA-OmpF porin
MAPGAQMKTQGLQMSLKASYALTNDWDIYGRAGAMGYRAESDVSGHNRFETGVRPLSWVLNTLSIKTGRAAWSISG